jgi:hypothetical protein
MEEVEPTHKTTPGQLVLVMALLGIIVINAITTFNTYREMAANTLALHTLKNSEDILKTSLMEHGGINTYLAPTSQKTAGPLTDPAARALLPGFRVPDNTKVTVYFDPKCNSIGCTSEFLQVNHCTGHRLAFWERYGDGSEIELSSLIGPECV